MRDPNRARKALFKAALTNADMTAKQWCEENEYSEGYLYQSLAGKHEAVPLFRKIDAFIVKHMPAMSGAA